MGDQIIVVGRRGGKSRKMNEYAEAQIKAGIHVHVYVRNGGMACHNPPSGQRCNHPGRRGSRP